MCRLVHPVYNLLVAHAPWDTLFCLRYRVSSNAGNLTITVHTYIFPIFINGLPELFWVEKRNIEGSLPNSSAKFRSLMLGAYDIFETLLFVWEIYSLLMPEKMAFRIHTFILILSKNLWVAKYGLLVYKLYQNDWYWNLWKFKILFFTMSCFDLYWEGNIFVIVIVFSFVTILVHKNMSFCLEVSRV